VVAVAHFNESQTMPVVQLEKPADRPLAEWFAELRSWFDLHRCETQGFSLVGRRLDRQIYLISFESALQARRFSLSFAHYEPVLRRATLTERDRIVGAAVG
jgi:hypothetical protein